MVTALTVHYNTPDLLERLLSAFRRFYDIPYWVIDGSDEIYFNQINNFADKYQIKIIHFNYNIHHGPGMAYGFLNIETDQILLLDSDLVVYNKGFLEDFQSKLRPESYGIGAVYNNIETEYVTYLHPACALINRKIALKYPLPTFYCSPMMIPMRCMQESGINIVQDEPWVHDDYSGGPNVADAVASEVHYVRHHWAGTMTRFGRCGV